MPTFTYRALQTDGKVAEGQIEAGGRAEAFRLIENLSLRPISLKEGANGKPKPAPKPFAVKASNGNGATAATEETTAPVKLSFGSPKISARVLENFTRLLS